MAVNDASDWMDAAKGAVTGRIYVHSGRDGRRLLTLAGEGPGEGFGIGPARAGDVDGDGSADSIVTSAWSLINGVRSGRAMIVSGSLR